MTPTPELEAVARAMCYWQSDEHDARGLYSVHGPSFLVKTPDVDEATILCKRRNAQAALDALRSYREAEIKAAVMAGVMQANNCISSECKFKSEQSCFCAIDAATAIRALKENGH